MQAPGSFTLIAAVVGIVAIALALSVIIGAPILAVPFFIVGFGIFLFRRGRERAKTASSSSYDRERERVPDTEETAADPARDSGVREATHSGSGRRHRPDAPGT
jgi:hypothetical protein